VAVASATVSWVAASRITSPDEAKRKAAPPKASLVTVPVERRALSANLVLRGGLSFDEATTISVPSAGSDAAGGASARVVTKDPPAVGTDIVEGQTVTEISGRPLLVLQGSLPVFRNLRPGIEGEDVQQLEVALQRLGLGPGPVDGTFDAATQSALDQMYRDAGYEPREPNKAQADKIDDARKQVAEAQRAVRAAQKSAREATTPKASAQLQQENELAAARRSLDKARAAAVKARDNAPVVIADAQKDLDAAAAVRTAAVAQLAAARAPGAVNPDSGDSFTPGELAALDASAAAAGTDVTAKTRAVSAARSAAFDGIAEADAAATDSDAALRLAFTQFLESRSATGDDERSGVSDALRSLADANESLADAESEIKGLPQAEVVFVRSLPRRVGSVSLERGDVAQGELMSVSGSNLAIRTSVTAADRTLVKVGSKVTIAESDLDIKLDGTVTSVADTPKGVEGGGSGDGNGGGDPGSRGDSGGESNQADRFEVEIAPGELPDAFDLPTLEGLNFRITIPVKSTDGDVLAVPAAALSATGDDRVQVEVLVQGSTTKFVEVTKGLAAQGYVEIAPVRAGKLNEGDEVVVGR